MDQWYGFLIRDLTLLQKTVGLLIHTVWKSIDYVVCLLYIYTFDPCWPQIFGFFIRMENIWNKNPKIWGRLRSNGLYLVHSPSFTNPKSENKDCGDLKWPLEALLTAIMETKGHFEVNFHRKFSMKMLPRKNGMNKREIYFDP